MIYQSSDFSSFPRRFRANFFNSILGYKPVHLVGSKNEEGVENLAIFSSAVHLGANPPLIGLICRPDSVPRHTLENIRKSGFYTLNQMNTDIVDQGHQTSAKYPPNISEFEEVGLTSEYKETFSQPFVQESQVKMGIELKEIIPIQINNTFFIIGEVIMVEIDEANIEQDGSLNYERLSPIAVTGLDTYHIGTQLKKLPYARP